MAEKCDTLKLDVSKEHKSRYSQLERIVSERHAAWTTATEHQMSNLTSSVHASLERIQQELQQRIEDLRSAFTEERNSHLKNGDEERFAFR